MANHLYEPPFKIETKIKNLDSKVKFNDDKVYSLWAGRDTQ